MFALAGGPFALGTFTDARVKAILPQAPGRAVFERRVLRHDHDPDADRRRLDRRDHAVRAAAAAPVRPLPSGASVVGLAELDGRRPLHVLRLLRGAARAARASSAASTRRASRAISRGGARTTSSTTSSLNFFDAMLNGDAEALGRLAPGVVAGIETCASRRSDRKPRDLAPLGAGNARAVRVIAITRARVRGLRPVGWMGTAHAIGSLETAGDGPRILAVGGGKGGVGKSVVSVEPRGGDGRRRAAAAR